MFFPQEKWSEPYPIETSNNSIVYQKEVLLCFAHFYWLQNSLYCFAVNAAALQGWPLLVRDYNGGAVEMKVGLLFFFFLDLAQIKTKSKQHHDFLLTLSWPAEYFNENMKDTFFFIHILSFKRIGYSCRQAGDDSFLYPIWIKFFDWTKIILCIWNSSSGKT